MSETTGEAIAARITKLYTMADAARQNGVDIDTVWGWIDDGLEVYQRASDCQILLTAEAVWDYKNARGMAHAPVK